MLVSVAVFKAYRSHVYLKYVSMEIAINKHIKPILYIYQLFLSERQCSGLGVHRHHSKAMIVWIYSLWRREYGAWWQPSEGSHRRANLEDSGPKYSWTKRRKHLVKKHVFCMYTAWFCGCWTIECHSEEWKQSQESQWINMDFKPEPHQKETEDQATICLHLIIREGKGWF